MDLAQVMRVMVGQGPEGDAHCLPGLLLLQPFSEGLCRTTRNRWGSLGGCSAALPLQPGETEQEGCWQHLKSPFCGDDRAFQSASPLQSGTFPCGGKVTVTALSFVCSDT